VNVSRFRLLKLTGDDTDDADFPHHKANHREYLNDETRFKEVVPIESEPIKKKIHSTWRLQYLKDVVLARILDDPTFSVLNSLIFFNQVDIVSHLQGNPKFLKELFRIIDSPETEWKKKKDAVCFIQQCCAIAKNLQAPARSTLYNNFVQNGLLSVIKFALLADDASFRIAGTDILVAMIDHDPAMVRAYIFKAINESKTPLTDTLIELLLREADHGVKAQAADAIKVLLDPQSAPQAQEPPRAVGSELQSKFRVTVTPGSNTGSRENLIQSFYEEAAKKLFQPLRDLGGRPSGNAQSKLGSVPMLTWAIVQDLTFQEVMLFGHLIEILNFFIRQHLYRKQFFIAADGLPARIAQLLACPQKHLKLSEL
jgi:protein phosphatase-4 regulatory subunit 3